MLAKRRNRVAAPSTVLCLLSLGVASGASPNAAATADTTRPSVAVTATARAQTIVPGADEWYEVTIRNLSAVDVIIDLGSVRVTGANFRGHQGGHGFVGGLVGMVAPPWCQAVTGFAVIHPKAAITTVVKVKAPQGQVAPTSLHISLAFSRITNLVDCKSEIIAVTDIPVRI